MTPTEPEPPSPSSRNPFRENDFDPSGGIDLRDLYSRLARGAALILGLGLVGFFLGGGGYLAFSPKVPITTSVRVVFSFPGFERGEYPDKSKFQADDLRSPVNIADAMRRLGLDSSDEALSKIRDAITIEGIIPDSIVKARDRIRASGQNPPPFLPDEYTVTLTLNPGFPLNPEQRNQLLVAIVTAARENFKRTYGQLPVAFGSALTVLDGVDYPEYEIVFRTEMDHLVTYLTNQMDLAKAFRSPTTNMSFRDLLEETHYVARIQLNGVLSLIRRYGLARDRKAALMKMDYYLQQLGFDEQHAIENEKVVRDLLSQANAHQQEYVLGTKSQAQNRPGEAPILDQGLIDSLTANDAYNLLVRRALEAGLGVKDIQTEKMRLNSLREDLQKDPENTPEDQAAILEQFKKSFSSLEIAYKQLVENVRKTQNSFEEQEYGDVIRLTTESKTSNPLKPIALAAAIGGILGIALGAGLSLLGFQIGTRMEK